MSCRTTQAGSAFTTYARLANGGVLSDVSTLSTFHHLRHLYTSRPEDNRRVYTEEEYRALLQRQIDRTRSNRNLDDARRESIIERLNTAMTDTVPDQQTLYALFNLNPTVRDRGNNLNAYIRQISSETGLDTDAVTAEFNRLERGITRTRGAGDPDTYTEENIAEARRLGLSTEAGTVHAVASLRDRARRIRADRALTEPQRVVRSTLGNTATYGDLQVVEAGHDARNSRVEVVVRNTRTNEVTTHAYRGIDAEQYSTLIGQGNDGITAAWATTIRSNPAFQYASQIEADLDSVAPRCGVCGQFANSSHGCPAIGEPRRLGRYTTNSRWSNQTVDVGAGRTESVRLPAITEFRTAFEAGAVRLDVNEGFSDYETDENGNRRYLGYFYQRGDLLVYRDENGAIQYNTTNLRCTCQEYRENNYHCRHTTRLTAAVTERLTPRARAASVPLTPEERERRAAEAAARAAEAAQTDWTRNEETLAEARRTWAAQAEVTYSEDFEGFESVYNAAVTARADNDGPQIPYMTDNALGGMATRASGQGFGMEIEYEFPPGTDIRTANRLIGEQLYAAGLVPSPNQDGYHAAGRNGYRDTHTDANGRGTWSWERDGSVNGGEIVSPVMYDEPETWEKVAKTVEILRANGAIASKRAGAHVHVGTPHFAGDPKKYAELARLMTQHEDVMFRLSSNPERGTHRRGGYTNPLGDVPVQGFDDVGRLRNWQGGRYRVLNFAHVNVDSADSHKDHPEFRIFDSTLDAGAMQSQVKLAVAMTHAAARIADAAPTARKKEEIGAHAKRRGGTRRRMTSDELKEDTATFRSLLDTLFTRKADKDQITSLFANTKWSR